MLNDITTVPTTEALADTGGDDFLGARRGKRAGARSARACVAAGGVPRIARRSSPLGKKGAFIACAKPAWRGGGRRGGSRMSDALLAEALGLRGGGCNMGAVEVMELGRDGVLPAERLSAEEIVEIGDAADVRTGLGYGVGTAAQARAARRTVKGRRRDGRGRFVPGFFGRGRSMRGHLGQFRLPVVGTPVPNRGMTALGIATGVLGGSFVRRMAPAGPVLAIGTGAVGIGLAFFAKGPFLSGVGFGLLPNVIEGLLDLLMGGAKGGQGMRGWGLGQEREPDVLGNDAGLDEAERALAQIRGLGQEERELIPLAGGLGQDDEVAQEAREAQAEIRGEAAPAMGNRDPMGLQDPIDIGVEASIMG